MKRLPWLLLGLIILGSLIVLLAGYHHHDALAADYQALRVEHQALTADYQALRAAVDEIITPLELATEFLPPPVGDVLRQFLDQFFYR